MVAIELRAIAGVTYPLVNKSFTPDAAASKLTDGLTPASVSASYLLGIPVPRGAVQRLRQPVLTLYPVCPGRASSYVRPGHTFRWEFPWEESSMAEHAAGPSGPGTVVMELGADIGALVLYTPADRDGEEIEISRDDDPAVPRTHSQVRPRHLGAVTKYAAVYPGLAAGPYTLWRDERTPADSVTITGGQITTCHWPD